MVKKQLKSKSFYDIFYKTVDLICAAATETHYDAPQLITSMRREGWYRL